MNNQVNYTEYIDKIFKNLNMQNSKLDIKLTDKELKKSNTMLFKFIVDY